jgi:hypothetical protein
VIGGTISAISGGSFWEGAADGFMWGVIGGALGGGFTGAIAGPALGAGSGIVSSLLGRAVVDTVVDTGVDMARMALSGGITPAGFLDSLLCNSIMEFATGGAAPPGSGQKVKEAVKGALDPPSSGAGKAAAGNLGDAPSPGGSAGAKHVQEPSGSGSAHRTDGAWTLKVPHKEYDALSRASVQNPDSNTLTLGKYAKDETSYTRRAGDTTYFDMGSDWNKVQDKYDLTDNEMFEYFNVPVLDDALSGGKTIRFSHDPIGDDGALGKEWKYIKTAKGLDDSSLVFEGGFWVVK